MVLNCAQCKEDFVATYWQKVRHAKGRTIFMCSLACRGAYGKQQANKNKGLKPLSLEKLARSRVRGALKRGDIKRPATCELCGTTAKLQAHHYVGYDKPLHIQWICTICHGQVDAHRRSRGKQHVRAKLDEGRVSEIKESLRSGRSLLSLARAYEVSKKTILNIKHDRIWRHVP